MPRLHVRLYIEESGRPEDETWGAPCNQLFKGHEDPIPDGLYGQKPQYLPLNNACLSAIVSAMNLDPVRIEKLLGDWSSDEGMIGIKADNPEGFIDLPSSHSTVSGENRNETYFLGDDVLFDFSREDFAVNLGPSLIFYVGQKIPNGMFVTKTMTEAQAAAVTNGTPLSEVIDMPALKDLGLTIDRIESMADGDYEIHLSPLADS